MPSSIRTDTTALIEAWERTGADAWQRLLPVVYDELRRVARRELQREWAEPTLDATGLVHEAFIRLVDDTRVTRKGRAYFFAAASRAMRQVLVDHARSRNAQKRGSGLGPVTLSRADDVAADADRFGTELLELDVALEELASLNPRQARVVECRFFAGMSVVETAEALEVSERTIKADWALARAWLYRRLDGTDPTPS